MIINGIIPFINSNGKLDFLEFTTIQSFRFKKKDFTEERDIIPHQTDLN